MMENLCHGKRIDDIVDEMKTHIEKGLSSQEASDRLRTHGPNELTEKPRPGFLSLLLDQFNNFLVIILIVAAVLSILLGEYIDAIAIIFIVALNAVVGVIQGLAEAVHFAQTAGLDVARVIDVLSKGAGQSWQMENRGVTMAKGEFDFGFKVDWMRKDLGIVVDEARRNGARLPVTAMVEQFYALLQARGCGNGDSSSLIRLLSGK